jgi:predicted XRE-type DNA-binding protein
MATRKKQPAAPLKDAEDTIFHGSGNVFADLGYKNADEMLARSTLLMRIADIIEQRKLSQAAAAKVLGLKQPDVSALLRGRFLRRFSTDRLMRFLVALDHDVEIVVKPRTGDCGRAHISVAMRG